MCFYSDIVSIPPASFFFASTLFATAEVGMEEKEEKKVKL
jgi:hypothetical protein